MINFVRFTGNYVSDKQNSLFFNLKNARMVDDDDVDQKFSKFPTPFCDYFVKI